MKKNILLNVIRVSVSMALLALLFWLFRKNLPDILKALARMNPWLFSLAILCMLINFFMMALRLRIILRSQKVNLSVWESNYLCFLGQFFNNFLPTSIGGDVVKAFYASKKSHSKVTAYAGVFADRLSGMVSLIFWAGVAMIFVGRNFQSRTVVLIFTVVLLGAALFLALLWYRAAAKRLSFFLIPLRFLKIDGKIRNFYDAIQGFKANKRALLKGFALSLVLQVISFYAAYLLARSVNAPAGLADFFCFMPIVGVAALLPSLNGLGIREGAFVYFFKGSMGAQNAFIVSLLLLLQNFTLSLIGGILYLSGRFRVSTDFR